MQQRQPRYWMHSAVAWAALFLIFWIVFIFALAAIQPAPSTDSTGRSWTIATVIGIAAMTAAMLAIQTWSQRRGMAVKLVIDGQITIARPIDEVFPFLADATNEPRWSPQIARVTWTSPGPIGLGSTYRQVTRAPGPLNESEWTITTYQPPHYLAVRGMVGKSPQVGIYTLAAVPAGTRVTAATEIATNILAIPFHPLTRALFRPFVSAPLKRLKGVLEASPN